MTPGSHALVGVYTDKGYRYLYKQLDGELAWPGECKCEQQGAINCPIDAHRVPATQAAAEF